MDQEQIQKLAKRLGVEITFLQSLIDRFSPKNEAELIQLINETSSLRQSLGENVTTDDAIDFLDYRRQQQVTPLEETKTPQVPGEFQPGGGASVNFENKYGQGYQFRPSSPSDLTGQCAWYAQQITRLDDGSTWTIGNTISQKRNKLNQYLKQGQAFLPGQGQLQPGQSVVIDTGTKWGHVATVAEVLPDGRIRLTESNFDNDQRVRHDRIIDQTDPSIVGFLKTKPTQEFKVEPPKTDPSAPTTQEKTTPPDNAAGGKQELLEEEIPIKPQDLQVGNPNVEQVKGLEKEQALQKANENLTDTTITKPEVKKTKPIGFLDVFQQPEGVEVEETKPQTPIIPTIKPVIKPFNSTIKSPTQLVTRAPIQARSQPRPQLQPQAQVKAPIQPTSPQVQTPIRQTPSLINIRPTIIRPTSNIQPPPSPLRQLVNRVGGWFRG